MSEASEKSGDALPVPTGFWGAILTATPIVLTVLATGFAGLSSSEMTRSMYYRSLAAQHQSKAGDQWAFFQAKRIRGTEMETTTDLLDSLGHAEPFDPARADAVCAEALAAIDRSDADAAARVKQAREQFAALKADGPAWEALARLTAESLPKVEVSTLSDAQVQAAVESAIREIQQRRTEAETAPTIAALSPADIESAIRNAERDADAFEQATKGTTASARRFREVLKLLTRATGSAKPREAIDRFGASFRAAAADFDGRRYRREADFNQRAAELYEVRVRRSAVESDRHRHRSELFFYSMLVAQFGVTVASLALARRQHSILWLLAAAAGLGSIGFTGYVFVTR